MVEHNLAKVGVASSNLVSRSILFFILVFPLFAQEIYLQDEYCVDNLHVKLSDIIKDKDIIEDKVLLKLPDSTNVYQIPTIKLSYRLKELGFESIKNEKGVITFKKFCDFNLEILYEKFTKAVKTVYPNAKIHSLKITPKNYLPKNMDEFYFKNISISKTALKKQQGVFLAKFITPQNRVKSIYFSFLLDAKTYVFISSKDLKSGTVISSNDFIKQEVSLDKIPINTLKNISPDSLIVKFNIKKGTILTQNSFKKKSLIKRGNYIKGILKDGALSLEIEVKALNSGNKGEKIRVLSGDGKTFNAIIINSQTVYIK